MDPVTVVIDLADEREKGDALIQALTGAGFPIDVAFWARADGDGRRYLYVASSARSGAGVYTASRTLEDIMRRSPELWADSFDIKLVSPDHAMAVAARDVIAPKSPGGPFAVPNPKSPPTMTRFGGSSLGGVEIEGPAYIFPPYPPGLGPLAKP